MSHPAALPELFLDRSLGRKKVPAILRAAGLRLVTLAEHYGIPTDERVADIAWLEEAGTRGWAVLMKDAAITVNEAEIAAVRQFGVRCFTLTRQDLPSHRMAAWFLNSLDRMATACVSEGPFVYGVAEAGISVYA